MTIAFTPRRPITPRLIWTVRPIRVATQSSPRGTAWTPMQTRTHRAQARHHPSHAVYRPVGLCGREADETLSDRESLPFNRLEGMDGGYITQSQLTTTNRGISARSPSVAEISLLMYIPTRHTKAYKETSAMRIGQAFGMVMSRYADTNAACGSIL